MSTVVEIATRVSTVELTPAGVTLDVGAAAGLRTGRAPHVLPAAVNLGGHRVVILESDGRLRYADHRTLEHRHAVLGVTLHAAALGDLVRVAGAGEVVTEPSWSWTAGAPLFLGEAGALTHSPPAGGFRMVVAVATAATTILVRIEPPILLT